LTDRQWFLLAVGIYGASFVYSVFLWRRGFRRDDRVNYVLLLAGCGAHTVAMLLRGFSLSRCPVNNLYEATIFTLWTIVAAYLGVGAWPRLRFLGAFASPLLFAGGVFALMPPLDPPHGPAPTFVGGWTSLHAALILLAYGAFGLGSVAALMYLTQERDLKVHKLRAVRALLPPIQRLETIVGRLLLAGFLLLTLGLAVGAAWVERPPGVEFIRDTKVIWSLFVWLVYLALLVMRWRFAPGGRRIAWGAVGSFVFVMLTFWGSNLLSSIHHPAP
jgi:ABC-type uncharacterized transport system permease subunit